MIQVGDGSVGMRRAVAATMAVGTGTAMWEAGELTLGEYVQVTQLGHRIYEGGVGVTEGMHELMSLLMRDGDEQSDRAY